MPRKTFPARETIGRTDSRNRRKPDVSRVVATVHFQVAANTICGLVAVPFNRIS
jgi:hypothetical protein